MAKKDSKKTANAEVIETAEIKNESIEEVKVEKTAPVAEEEAVVEEVQEPETVEEAKEETQAVEEAPAEETVPIIEPKVEEEPVIEPVVATKKPVVSHPIHDPNRRLSREFNFTWNGMSY